MKNYIYMIILILIILYLLLNECKLEKFETETCKIYTHPDLEELEWFCESEYGNMGDIQLVYAIKESKDEDIRGKLKRIYDIKKSKNLLGIPCHYNFDRLKRNMKNSISDEKYQRMNIEKSENNDHGANFTWMRCDHEGGIELPESSDRALYTDEYVVFNKTDLASIREEVCKSKRFYMNEREYRCNDSSNPCIFLCIECKVLDVENLSVIVKSISILKYNNKTGKLEENEMRNTCYIQEFMTITYDSRSVHYIPYRSKRNIVIMSRDLCGNYEMKESKVLDFDLSMVGIEDSLYILSRHMNGIRLNSKMPYYKDGYVEEGNYGNDEKELRTNLKTYSKNMVSTFKDRYSKCERRKKIQIDGLYKQGYDVSRLEEELKHIINFVDMLDDYVKNDKSIDKRLIGKENISYRYCKYSLSNPGDLDELYNNYKKCEESLEERSSYHAIDSDKRLKFEKTIKKIKDFIKYVDMYKLREREVVPASAIMKLRSMQDSIGRECNTSDNSTFTIRTIKRKLSKIENDLDTKGITDKIFKTVDESMNLVVDGELLRYISNDNCIYLPLELELGDCV